MSVNERKMLYVFFAIAFGVMALMSIFMVIGLKGGKDLTVFVNAMMTYPACGVILGMMLFDRKEKKLPMVGFITFLVTSAIMVIMAVISAFAPQQMIDSGMKKQMQTISNQVLTKIEKQMRNEKMRRGY